MTFFILCSVFHVCGSMDEPIYCYFFQIPADKLFALARQINRLTLQFKLGGS